jgi:hypothetical protein
MRRLARQLITLCSAASLLMCVAMCVLWALSYRVRDELFWGNLKSSDAWRYRSLMLRSNCGRMMLYERSGGSRSDGFFWDRYQPNSNTSLAGWTSFGPGIWIKDPDARPGPGSRAVLFSFWYPIAFFAFAPTCWTVTTIHRRRKRGLCQACGYDLRAGPGRCPECGTLSVAGAKGGV